MGVDDVIVDDYGKIASKLRALYGLKNTLGSRFSSTTRLIPTMAS